MPRESSRSRRVGEQLRRELAQLIRDEISDPRMAMVSITTVEVSRDLAHAKVYVTILIDPSERASIVEALNHAAPMLHRQLGRRMHIRIVPRPRFLYDESIERGARLDSLITSAIAADEARRHQDESDDPGSGTIL